MMQQSNNVVREMKAHPTKFESFPPISATLLHVDMNFFTEQHDRHVIKGYD